MSVTAKIKVQWGIRIRQMLSGNWLSGSPFMFVHECQLCIYKGTKLYCLDNIIFKKFWRFPFFGKTFAGSDSQGNQKSLTPGRIEILPQKAGNHLP